LQEIAITPEEDTKENASAEVTELKEKRSELQNSIKNTEQHIERLRSQDSLLAQYSSGLFSAGKDATTSDLLDQTTIGRVNYY
jgi:FtsZ-binding cell division protein ZapB